MKRIQFSLLAFAILLFCACGGLNEKQKKASDDALKALKKIDASTDVGVNQIEYSRLLIEAQSAAKEADSLLPDGGLKTELKLAMEAYIDAKTILQKANGNESVLACSSKTKEELEKDADRINSDSSASASNKMFRGLDNSIMMNTCNADVTSLTKKYDIPTADIGLGKGLPGIITNEGLTIIWKAGSEHINKASALAD